MRTLVGVPSSARVFILEDDARRIAFFRERLLSPKHPVAELFITASCEEASEYLRSSPRPDIMFLDHDLSVEQQSLTIDPSHSENSGSLMARLIAENGWWAPDIIIHTWNPAGAAAMVGILASVLQVNVKYMLFGTFDLRTL